MKHYATYSREDFLHDDAFLRWVRQPDPYQDQWWETFLAAYPHQRDTVQQARKLVEGLAAFHPPVTEEEVSGIWAGIDQHLSEDEPPVARPLWGSFRPFAFRAAAAAVICLLGLGWWLYREPAQKAGTVSARATDSPAAPAAWEVVENTGVQARVIRLPDGSSVTLEPKSRLKYARQFAHNRELFLSGDAFFDVKRNPAKPFRVHTNGLVTRVLGTSFRVRAFERDARVIVQVRTGRVAVYPSSAIGPHPETAGLLLTPNQQAVYLTQSDRLQRGLVEAPRILITEAELPNFVFEEAPVSQIFTAIEGAYGVDVVFDEETLRHCLLSTSLTNETLYEKLDVVCKAIGATYQLVDAQILITGPGCSE